VHACGHDRASMCAHRVSRSSTASPCHVSTGIFPASPPMAAAQEGILLLVHGEVTDPAVDFFDREKVFIERHLKPLLQQLPDLKVTLYPDPDPSPSRNPNPTRVWPLRLPAPMAVQASRDRTKLERLSGRQRR